MYQGIVDNYSPRTARKCILLWPVMGLAIATQNNNTDLSTYIVSRTENLQLEF